MNLGDIRLAIRAELATLEKKEISAEFAELCQISDDNGLTPMDYDISCPAPSYCQNDDELEKVFAANELRKDAVVRSRIAPAHQEIEPEEQSCEEFFGECEKRSSDRHKIKLTKRLIPETNEILVEGWSASGECCYTKIVSAGDEIGEQPLAKSEIMSQMLKTLNQVRNLMTAEDVELCQKAIAALDIPCFLELVRRAKTAA